ncbi:MAG: ArnT family glycosyltransferase, partial [Chloroflexota bacterium]
MIARLREKVATAPRPASTALLILAVALVAGLTRLIELGSVPPGFRLEGATQVLFSRQIGDGFFPIFFGQEAAVSEPFLPYFIRLVSETGLDIVTTARLSAGLSGTGVAVACALWYRRVFGLWWGLAGGLLVATSFWQLMFSRQATPEMGTAFFSAVGLWCLWEGITRTDRDGRRFSIWYVASGLAFAGTFYVDVIAIALPGIVLVMVLPLIIVHQRENRQFDGSGILIMLGVMLVALAPLTSFYLDNPEIVRHNLEVSGGIPERLTEGQQGVLTLGEHLFWRGGADPATNLPGRPLLDPILAALTVLGFAWAIAHPLRPVHIVVLTWILVSIVPSALLNPESPAMLLPLTPVLFALPLIATKAAVEIAQRHRPRLAPLFAGLIAALITISAGWSLYDYFWQWPADDRVYQATNGDLRDAIEAAERLDGDDIPIYLATGDRDFIARAIAPELVYRPVVERDVLPMPARGVAFIIYPSSLEPHPALIP